MRHPKLRNLTGALLLSGALGTAAAPAAADTIELSLGDFQSTQHVLSREGAVYWMRLVEEKTGGAVKFTHYPSEQAAPARSLLDAVKTGILDLAFMGPPYNTDVLPLNSVVGLPGFYTSSVQGSEAMHALVRNGDLYEEFLGEGVVPIFSVVLPPYQVLLKDRQVGMPADWTGLNIRTGGTTQALTARALGAVGVSLPGPEVYMAVERGRVDGILFPLASVPGYNLQEVVKHISTNGALGGYSMVLIVNGDLFDGLPAEVQTAMLEAGNQTSVHLAKAQDDSIGDLVEQWRNLGINVFEFSEAELDATAAATNEVAEEWVTRVGGQNPKAADVLQAYREALGLD